MAKQASGSSKGTSEKVGKNMSKIPLSSQEQDDIRRAKKRKSGTGNRFDKQNSLYYGAAEDARKERQQRQMERELIQQELEQRKLDFRKDQAAEALRQECFTRLIDGSPAKQLAEAAILMFPEVIAPEGQSRTQAAIADAKRLLGIQVERRNGAITLGINAVFKSLSDAFGIVKDTKATAKQTIEDIESDLVARSSELDTQLELVSV